MSNMTIIISRVNDEITGEITCNEIDYPFILDSLDVITGALCDKGGLDRKIMLRDLYAVMLAREQEQAAPAPDGESFQ